MVDDKHLKSLVCQRQQKSYTRSCVKKPRCDPPSTRLQHISLVIFRLRSQNIVMYILHPLTNARKVHLRAQKLGLKKVYKQQLLKKTEISLSCHIYDRLLTTKMCCVQSHF